MRTMSDDKLLERLTETSAQLEEIVRLQSGVIDNLFQLLLQHISADSAELKPIIENINHAAAIRKEEGL